MNRLVIVVLQAILLSIVVDAATSGIEAHSIYACCGESVRLFQNVSRHCYETETNIYKSSATIGNWLTFNPQQQDERHVYDNYGNIWMHNIDVSDDATYTVIQTSRDNMCHGSRYEVRLIVMVAPEKSCRPQLNREGDTLIASLETGAACGNPEATAYWLDYPYLTLESQAKAKLSPGKEAGTYYACIETRALRCAGRYKPVDVCSSLTIDESNYHTVTDTLIKAISIGCLVLFLVTVANCYLLKQLIKKKKNQGQQGMMDIFSCWKPRIG